MAVIVPTLRHERRLWNEGLTRVVGVDEVGVAPTCASKPTIRLPSTMTCSCPPTRAIARRIARCVAW